MRDLERLAGQALDQHLLRDHPRPVAIALSGGGDSLALTLIADAWARRAGRAGRGLVILTVDHGLQAESRAWTQACAAVARRLGRPFRALAWTGEKPANGLPAAARAARHRLLAQAAREAGAAVILMGHTADDLGEAAAMRAAGSTTPDPRLWAPSPVWPEGRDRFVLRPLLAIARADLRAWLAARGETWIDDPANADPRYARSRARLAAARTLERSEPPPPGLAALAEEQAGIITLDRRAFRGASLLDAQRFVALASVCAGGGERRPATARLGRVAEGLRTLGPFVATLAGARIEANDETIRILREAGEVARGGMIALELTPGRPVVWDGRFEISGERPGQTVRRLAGLARRLPEDQQRALRGLPPSVRGALPAVVDADGSVACPALTGLASLIGPRLRAAAGLVDREPV